jgi:hypothetical protein
MSDSNLTGIWNGQYFYRDGRTPVLFVATLIETANALTGSMHEICTVGERAGETIYASLAGERFGNAVTFMKTYDPPDEVYTSVAYDGTLDSSETEIVGRWTIRPFWSGTFIMVRSSGAAARTAKKVSERV